VPNGSMPPDAVPGTGPGAGAAGALVPREFFARPAEEMAPELLGCVLEHETPEGLVAVALTEVEAYAGARDPASHAYRGRTERNDVMFGPPGYVYVYFTYGMHFCVNLVCMPPGVASAVLLRAGRVIAGTGLARARRMPVSQRDARSPRRQMEQAERDLARGPARLCQALGIDQSHNGADVCDPASPLRLRAGLGAGRTGTLERVAGESSSGPPADVTGTRLGTEGGNAGEATARSVIRTGPRVGVRLGAEVPWRFWLAGEPTVSAYRAHVPRRR
jgi:DNA-3-methyladenine glycosylase